MKKTKTQPRSEGNSPSSGATGTYVYDAELGRVVKVSGRVPGLSKSSEGSADVSSSDDGGPGGCGRGECAGGACMGMGD
jgi:hypothetical protein